MADIAARDFDALSAQQPFDMPVHDEQFLERRRAQAVDEHGDAPWSWYAAVAPQALHHGVGPFVRGSDRAFFDAGLAVDSHPDLDLALGHRKPRFGCAGDEARRQRDADRPRAFGGALRDAGNAVEAVAARG